MEQIQVQLIPEQRYTIKLGSTIITGATATSEWEGMTRLECTDGTVLIVEHDGTPLQRAFDSLFAGILGSDKQLPLVTVVKGSPSLLEKLVAGMTPDAPIAPSPPAPPRTSR